MRWELRVEDIGPRWRGKGFIFVRRRARGVKFQGDVEEVGRHQGLLSEAGSMRRLLDKYMYGN